MPPLAKTEASISSFDQNPAIITVLSELPAVESSDVVIDGWTQVPPDWPTGAGIL